MLPVEIIEIEGEGHAVVEYELDRDILPRNARVQGSELGKRRDFEGDVSIYRVGDQDYFMRFLLGTAAQESGGSERMVRPAPADDLHTKNIPVEFRRCSRIGRA